ncbi:hypothetical protein BH11PSE9_BH11PSE9_23900 [soil metagenome]
MPPSSQLELKVIAGCMTSSGVRVTCVGPNLYRLDEEAALFLGAEDEDEADSFPRFGDVMLVEPVSELCVRYVEVHQRGPYKQFCFEVTRNVAESEATAAFLASVSTAGGHWERHMGGLLFIAVPEGSELDPLSLFDNADS